MATLGKARGSAAFGLHFAGAEDFIAGLDIAAKLGLARPAMEKAWKKALKPMVAAAKIAAPVGKNSRGGGDSTDPYDDNEKLRDSIGIIKSTRRRRSEAKLIVTATARHAHLVHDGTAARIKRSTGQAVGRMRPNKFLQRAFDATADGVFAIFASQMSVELGKLADRIRKRALRGTLGKGMKRKLRRLS
ncbi:MAG: HK97 gp10 family phage protein [Candidatus Eisenbacteria sp.]|nr:HK97 gp10 family phage protein [Candidatus Eisenbacteria bacterium]